MDQIKIGKFIAKCRKDKNMTQSDLAFKLGVTDKSIGNWENGRNMPDLSLFKPLCEELGISINDLMSGEIVDEKDYKEKLEENIVNTIDYSTNKENKNSMYVSILFICFGLFICASALLLIPGGSSKGILFCLFGLLIFTIGIFKLLKKTKLIKRIIISILVFIIMYGSLIYVDYLNVKSHKQLPVFWYMSRYSGDGSGNQTWEYDAAFYKVVITLLANKDIKIFKITYK